MRFTAEERWLLVCLLKTSTYPRRDHRFTAATATFRDVSTYILDFSQQDYQAWFATETHVRPSRVPDTWKSIDSVVNFFITVSTQFLFRQPPSPEPWLSRKLLIKYLSSALNPIVAEQIYRTPELRRHQINIFTQLQSQLTELHSLKSLRESHRFPRRCSTKQKRVYRSAARGVSRTSYGGVVMQNEYRAKRPMCRGVGYGIFFLEMLHFGSFLLYDCEAYEWSCCRHLSVRLSIHLSVRLSDKRVYSDTRK